MAEANLEVKIGARDETKRPLKQAQHAVAAGQRAVRKFDRNRAMYVKEIAALKKQTLRSIMAKMGVRVLFKDSRTYRKVMLRLAWRDARLMQLSGKVL